MKKVCLIILYMITCFLMFPTGAGADTGPKPSLTIIVEGMGDEEYWLDLLVSDEANYMWLDISDEERERVSKLAEYNQDGLHAALLKGTHIPMNGSIRGEKQPDGSYIHKFTYVGVPTEFKIAILKSDGTLIISDKVKRNFFQSVMEYTLSSSSISEKAGLSGTVKEIFPRGYILGFLQRMAATLIIEIGAAILFKFSLKKNWKVLLFTNIATQAVLNIIIILSAIQNGQASGFLTYFFAELLVAATEMIVYSNLLSEKKNGTRILYAVTANTLSFMAGFLIFPLS